MICHMEEMIREMSYEELRDLNNWPLLLIEFNSIDNGEIMLIEFLEELICNFFTDVLKCRTREILILAL